MRRGPEARRRPRDCGDFADHCKSGYTFFRRDNRSRSTADQVDAAHEYVYIVYESGKPGTEVDTGTTYGSIDHRASASQSGAYFVRMNGATGASRRLRRSSTTRPSATRSSRTSRRTEASLHVVWWDSRQRPVLLRGASHRQRRVGRTPSVARRVGRDVDRLRRDVDRQGADRPTSRATATTSSSTTGAVPFAGDYLWVTSMGGFDVRRRGPTGATRSRAPTRARRPRTRTTATPTSCSAAPSTAATALWSGDTCPHDGGLDQNIYGAPAP